MRYCLVEYHVTCFPILSCEGRANYAHGFWVGDFADVSEARSVIELINSDFMELTLCVYKLGRRYFTLYSAQELLMLKRELKIKDIKPLCDDICPSSETLLEECEEF